ncbi:MAG: helix-turn-helix domain-containing protein [Alistipes onderdonkii]
MRRSPTGSFRRATRFSGWDSARRSSACTRSSSAMRSGNRPVTSRSRRGSCSSCWVRSTTSTGTFCSTTRWPSARSTRRAPSSNARSRAVSRRRGSPNACRSAIRGSARCSGSMPEPRLRNISRRSGSCVPELLDTTELTVAEIAYRLRFETPSHFSTFFRKREGVPPQQYRRERRQPGR